ncbi:MAG: phosphopyruvate hydratase, partial [bacterium]
MPFIKDIIAREILDSRGNPTIITKLYLDNGFFGTGQVPSGLFPNKNEFGEIRDNDSSRYNGNGVKKAVEIINNKIKKALIGISVNELTDIDYTMIELDGTENMSNLGRNSIFSVSLAATRAIAESQNLPLYKYLAQTMKLPTNTITMPIPLINMING